MFFQNFNVGTSREIRMPNFKQKLFCFLWASFNENRFRGGENCHIQTEHFLASNF